MANLFMFSSTTLKSIICLLLLATTLANSARLLDDITDPTVPPGTTINPDVPIILSPPTTSLPSGQFPAAISTNVATVISTEPLAPIVPPLPDSPVDDTLPPPVIAPVPDIPSNDVPPVTANAPPLTTTTTTTAAIANDDHPTLSFFMHDILGGSHPSGRVVAGIVANTDANNLPFSQPNNQIFPINGGVPLNTINGVINNNNLPFLAGLNGSPTNSLIQNNGNNVVNNNNNNQAFVTAGQLPAGLTVQQLMFGSATVVDNEITEGQELGSAVLGSAQGFYLTSSTDGSSHTLALTALFHGSDHEIDDTISFFGVHRTATPISHIAVVGGTGKYENAKGHATIETLPHEDQHTTDGVETITHFTVYLTA